MHFWLNPPTNLNELARLRMTTMLRLMLHFAGLTQHEQFGISRRLGTAWLIASAKGYSRLIFGEPLATWHFDR